MAELIVTIIQIILSILLIVVIMLQQKSGGLGAAFGGSTFVNTKRGIDLSLHRLTIVLAILFFASSFALLFV